MNGSALVRGLSRIGVVGVALIVLSGIGVQYAHVIGRNVALARQLHDTEHDIVALKAREAQQRREIRRLSDPHGAIPEIHDRLHLVGDKEAIIYLKHGRAAPPPRAATGP
jgi:cell division protein FtsB